MNTLQAMGWQAFKERLQQDADQVLQFQYGDGKWVEASYHITEIKQAPIVSVDCGGVMNSWTEIIIQLWEPGMKQAERAMKVSKALAIIDVVEKSLPLNPKGTVKIEFGNSRFDTRQMYPGQFISEGENLIIDLVPDFTQCKAISRGGNCGTTADGEECCAPGAAVKPKVQLANLAVAPSCVPGSGCC
ncbi:hypothetical protein EDD80_101620 [Anseongella ginsenosidimutans]|uniref:Uncharacterized protein n=1 Tax=Anseongella ginsenosidimutans TaxID=496056 RepID=A0A4R3L0I7_9SPHI|nr:DUF6428 family protein [Anseongella ginsenosidimutans]QEC50940.1 hypothetical protein FRZ59_00270 [Anseongella ginsenosidimutans]TCS90420.1 hypothetical protein EDD80_101620 [Anseongella ginsenosidimutans]